MTVELAALVPVVVAVAVAILNLMGFIDACAAFDRLSLDAVVAHGVAPSGDDAGAEVEGAIRAALGREGRCEVSVAVEDVSGGGESASFVISPLLKRYVCRLSYKPWPSRLRMPGVTLDIPLELRHERALVVDGFRPGVVM